MPFVSSLVPSKPHPNYFRYWAKAKPVSEQFSNYHLLPFHSLDVAAVGWCLLEPDGALCQRLSKQLNVCAVWFQGFFCYCLMLHDLGKFARAFQNLVPSDSPNLVGYSAKCTYRERHDTLGFLLWKKNLRKRLSDIFSSNVKLEPWLEVVCGHHGQPPKKSIAGGLQSHFLEEDEQAAEDFIRETAAFWLPDLTPLLHIDKTSFTQVSWQLAGVAVLADWIGSDQQIFNYCSDPVSLPNYWKDHALPKASKAVESAPLLSSNVSPFDCIRQLFPFIEQPTPLQNYAISVPLVDGPQLFLLEDVTGSGKTEAAMVLCQRIMANDLAKGVYVALPTMATANGMYDRLVKCYRQLYVANSEPSLVLAHGARNLSDQFVDSVALSPQRSDSNYQREEQSASAYCNAWLADSRKKALLADVGVGTIDQALLAVLPARHQSLRLLGLADKVLLVDEVHAYDPYMRRLLTALLEAHARQGGSAILLSATVPFNLRKDLLDSYARGLNTHSPLLSSQSYPLATHCGDSALMETALETRNTKKRFMSVVRLSDEHAALSKIHKAISEGRCICWIRNTVGDAYSSYAELSQQEWMPEGRLTLFHSRFAMVDRQAIELDVLSRFGRDSSAVDRAGQVLIATQVVEQSLDLDFDEMISDLAPIDLLIQRAGRLQRHNRDSDGRVDHGASDSRPSPCLYMVAPDPNNVTDTHWLKTLLPGTQAVYADVGQLWLTLDVLMEKGGFAMPEDARYLIESVYGDEVQRHIPEPLLLATFQAQGEERGEFNMAELNRLRLDKGYTRNSADSSGGWNEDIHIPTRLSAESVSVALAVVEGNTLKPYADAERHSWQLSQLSIPAYQWEQAKDQIPVCWQESIIELKEQTPELRWSEICPLTDVLMKIYSDKYGWVWHKSNA